MQKKAGVFLLATTQAEPNGNYYYYDNIRQQSFGDNSSNSVRYDFVYDNLSRLTDATSSGSYGANDAYGCHYRYDKMGNPIGIVTNGLKLASTNPSPVFSNILYDDLSFAYNGNQLRKVTDAGDKSANTITEQFNDYTDADVEYAFNTNGAMTKDLNKGISSISYNLLNLPQQVDILSPVGEARNTYTYTAGGQKLRVVKKYNSHFNSSPVIGSAVNTSNLDVTKTTDYVGNLVFENNSLSKILVDGGYISNNTYYFYETDHLGDHRTVVSQSGTVVERDDYYPFGMQMAHNQIVNEASAVNNPYKYNGKELDVMHGLNLYDFAARMQDPALGRFTTVDPLAEEVPEYSPYSYCHSNSINNIDPDGRWVWAAIGAALDYGLQVYDNYKQSGKIGYNELVGNVNFVSIGLSAINPAGKFAAVKTLAVEVARETVKVTANKGLEINTDAKDVAIKAVENTAVSIGATKLSKVSSDKALKQAENKVVNTNNKVSTAERRVSRSPNSSAKAKKLQEAQSMAKQARSNQVTIKILNSTVGKFGEDATSQTLNLINNRLLNGK